MGREDEEDDAELFAEESKVGLRQPCSGKEDDDDTLFGVSDDVATVASFVHLTSLGEQAPPSDDVLTIDSYRLPLRPRPPRPRPALLP